MLRVLGGPLDPSTHLENRIGEPAANPYLYMAAQLMCGLDGIENDLDPGQMSVNPHQADGPRLPKTLGEAIAAATMSDLVEKQFGTELQTLITALKANEWARFAKTEQDRGQVLVNGVSDWEQREYFRVY